MRVRTRSACVVLAWGILLLLSAAGSSGSPRPAQANNRTANTTTSTTSTIQATLTRTQTSSPTSTQTRRPGARPGGAAYVVQPGETLSGIAAALGTRGGWPALYAANRQAIGPDPDVIHTGTELTIPVPASPPASTSRLPARRPASPPTSAKTKAPAAGGLPRWLQIVLLAAGILIGAAFLTEALAIARRRRNAHPAAGPATDPAAGPATGPTACTAADRRILLADYDRLVVTSSAPDGTICVLRPPGADPEVILLAARLVLAQDRYEELAGHLGVTAHRRE